MNSTRISSDDIDARLVSFIDHLTSIKASYTKVTDLLKKKGDIRVLTPHREVMKMLDFMETSANVDINNGLMGHRKSFEDLKDALEELVKLLEELS